MRVGEMKSLGCAKRSRRSGQSVADSPDGGDPRGGVTARGELAPQAARVAVDRAGRSTGAVLPDRAQQLLAGEHPLGLAREMDEQVELHAAKIDLAALERHDACARVDP